MRFSKFTKRSYNMLGVLIGLLALVGASLMVAGTLMWGSSVLIYTGAGVLIATLLVTAFLEGERVTKNRRLFSDELLDAPR